MKKISIALAAVAAAASTPAFAEAPSGSRLEVLVGWDKVSLDLNDYGLGSYDKDGVAYAVGVGYDIPTAGSVAFGVDAEISGASTKFVYDDGVDYVKVSTGRDLYVGGRITAAVNPKLNLYGKVGYTNARIKGEANGFTDAANGDGVRFGLGAQLQLSAPIYSVLEYRYSNYEANISRNQVLVGIGARF